VDISLKTGGCHILNFLGGWGVPFEVEPWALS